MEGSWQRSEALVQSLSRQWREDRSNNDLSDTLVMRRNHSHQHRSGFVVGSDFSLSPSSFSLHGRRPKDGKERSQSNSDSLWTSNCESKHRLALSGGRNLSTSPLKPQESLPRRRKEWIASADRCISSHKSQYTAWETLPVIRRNLQSSLSNLWGIDCL